MISLFWITVGIGALWLVLFAGSLLQIKRMPRIRPARGASHGRLPRVSVIIPARNEEANIITCLESLLSQDHTDIEVIVVDDGSEDKTADLVARVARGDYRVRLVSAEELPAGWMGKCHAIHQGVTRGRPSGEWLLFVDADTVHESQSISAPLQVAIDRGVDMISIIPHLEAGSFWERLMQPTMAALISMFNNPARINNPDLPDVFANGQFIMVRREAYERAGGHEAVRGKVLEDVELARAVVASGGRNFFAMGRDLLTTRMYTSLKSLSEGWSKNFFMILQSRLPKVVLAGCAVVILSLWPALVGLGSLVALGTGWRPWPTAWLWAAVGIYALVTSFQATLRGLNRWYPRYAFLAPLANAMAMWILLRSARRHRAGSGVSWKGRVVFDDKEDADGKK